MTDRTRRYCVVLTTAGSEEVARRIARALVERRLAACVNVVPSVRSLYRWKGEVTEDEELLLVIKTAEDLFPSVRAAIRELHSYELPEAILLPIRDGDPGYLAWLEESLAPPS